jgi:hypothetical protein
MAGTDSYTSRGGGNDATRQRRAQDQKMWADMLKMINTATPQTMLGFGLGKLLRGAWDHYWDRKAENTDLNGKGNTIQGRADNTTYTIGGIDPRTATVDTANSYYGIAPTKGLLGTNLGVGQKQTTQEQPNGQTTTTTETYAFNPNDYAIAAPERMTLNEMAARQILGDNDPYGLNSKKNPLGNINLRY